MIDLIRNIIFYLLNLNYNKYEDRKELREIKKLIPKEESDDIMYIGCLCAKYESCNYCNSSDIRNYIDAAKYIILKILDCKDNDPLLTEIEKFVKQKHANRCKEKERKDAQEQLNGFKKRYRNVASDL